MGGASSQAFFFFFLALSIATTSALPTPTPRNYSSSAANTDFIRTSCTCTLYRDLCFSSLARYAPSVHSDPVRLAQAAAKVAAAKIRSASVRVSQHLRAGSADRREAAALRDCAETLGDAVDRTRRSAAEIARPGGPDLAWRVSNAQTWMSGAITNEVTCADGFDAVAGGAAKADVVAQMGMVRQYSSNALALVNKLAHGP
ncbi:putative 21 kDa protein-like [Iris pallida]|uniref:21 kDa protein-like n=1 Tax=Iris pallida TaxID=29817 RepID=A0AAX6FP21_IRIPA|nr:putative 21 kDa protein-like [Iris pallida]KAJ6844947.1 putative 21 kDa protein-like [Iris pallida]